MITFAKLPETRNKSIHKLYQLCFINGHPSDYKRCLKCKAEIKYKGSNNSGLHKHHDACVNTKSPTNNVFVRFAKFSEVDDVGKRPKSVARLVYEDNSFNVKVKVLEKLQSYYVKIGFDKVTCHSVHSSLNAQYQTSIDLVKNFTIKRKKRDLLCILFDKFSKKSFKTNPFIMRRYGHRLDEAVLTIFKTIGKFL